MKRKDIFNLRTLILFIIIFELFLVLYLPVYWQIECITTPCNPVPEFISIFSIDNPRVNSINYIYLAMEFFASLVISVLVSLLYEKIKK